MNPSFQKSALKAWRAMELARAFDAKISAIYKAGKIMGGVFLGRGHEAIAACEGVYLQRGFDVYSPFIRELAGRFAWGDTPLDSARVYLGSKLSCVHGRDGNVHWGKPLEGNPAPISHLGAMVSVVAGMMLAKRFQGVEGAVGLACCGDGTTSTGAFHEACNMIGVERLPVVVVVTNNLFAYSTPNEQEFPQGSLQLRGGAYGMQSHECDGTDFLATLATMHKAIEAARSGQGPQWVLAHTLRMCGHGEHDDASYISPELKAEFAQRDCVHVARQQLLDLAWITQEQIEEETYQARELVQAAMAQAQREPKAKPEQEEWQALSCACYNEKEI